MTIFITYLTVLATLVFGGCILTIIRSVHHNCKRATNALYALQTSDTMLSATLRACFVLSLSWLITVVFFI